MSEKKLSLFDSSSDSEVELKINENYASRYNVWRNKEELQKYKDLKKNESFSESESSSESEDDTVSSDDEFFAVLSLCKGKDPRIYDKNYKAFKEKGTEEKKKKMVKEKPMYMKDYERSLVLERGGKLSDDDDEQIIAKEPTYGEEQASLKKGFKEALGDFSDDDDDLLKVREKSKKEIDVEEADYRKWLKGEEVDLPEDTKKNLSYLRSYWTDPNLNEDEKFLRDYFLEKKYLVKNDSEIPSYEDITNGILSDDEMTEEREKFELKYNYRYQEPDEEFIKRYPRTFADSVRKVDNRRKQKREEKAERQKAEKLQKKEEIKRLKALKRKEIEEKFMKLKEVSGQDVNFNESDIEGDFDPDKYDKKMREMFSDEYYQVEEQQQPKFEYDEELDSEKWDIWTGEKLNEPEKNINDTENDEITESGEISDQNKVIIDPKEEFEKEMIEASRPKKKLRKKSLFAKIISQPKPLYDPDGKSFEEYLNEYYKLDCEDIIGDMPVRYKYRKVIPNDFGLSVDEILAADDRDLNRWCSVKKTCQYRNDDEELYDVQAYRKKSQNLFAKKKRLPSLFFSKETDDNEIQSKNKNIYHCEEINPSTISVSEDTVSERGGEMEWNAEENIIQKSKEDHNSSVQFIGCKKKSKKKKKGKLNNSGIDINISKRPEESEDAEQCNTHLEQNVSDHINSTKKAAEKKSMKEEAKEKQCSSLESEHFNAAYDSSNMDSDMNQKLNNPDFSTDSEHKRKLKRKHKKVQNISDEKTDPEYSYLMLDKNTQDKNSINLESTSHKSSKRKREFDTDSPQASYSETVNSSTDISPKKYIREPQHNKTSNNNNSLSTSINCSFVPESTSLELPKKKKKKKRQNKNDSLNNVAPNHTQWSKSKTSNQNKHFELASGDKRLGVSDERLAAYGINPKKFKGKIMYGKK